jgi:hypothetical protein
MIHFAGISGVLMSIGITAPFTNQHFQQREVIA